MAISVVDGLSHRLELLDFIRGLLRLELEHPGVLEDIQDGGTLGSLA